MLQLYPSVADVVGDTGEGAVDVACVALDCLGDRRDQQHSHGESLIAAEVGCTEAENRVVGSQLTLVCALTWVCR